MCLIHSWATVHKLCVYMLATRCISAFFSSEGWQTVPRTCQGVYFSLFGARGCRWVCFVPSALFGLSVTPVRPIPVWTAGWVHTLSINLSLLRVHVLMCVNVCFCVTMSGGGCGRVGGPCPIYNNCQLSVTNTSSVLLPVKGRWGTLRVFPPVSNGGSDHLSFIGSVHWRTILSPWDAKFHLQSSLGNRSKVFPLQRWWHYFNSY